MCDVDFADSDERRSSSLPLLIAVLVVGREFIRSGAEEDLLSETTDLLVHGLTPAAARYEVVRPKGIEEIVQTWMAAIAEGFVLLEDFASVHSECLAGEVGFNKLIYNLFRISTTLGFWGFGAFLY